MMQLDLTDAVAPALLLGFLAFEYSRFRRDWEAFRVEKLPELEAVTAMQEMDKFIRRGFYMDGVRDLAKAWLFSALVMAALRMLGVV